MASPTSPNHLTGIWSAPVACLVFRTAALALLTSAPLASGIELISWTLPGQLNHTTTNGAPMTDSVGWSESSGSYSGGVSADLSQSDLSVAHSGDLTTYGVSTAYESYHDLFAYNLPGQTGTVIVTVTPYVVVRDWGATSTPADSGWSAACDVYFNLVTSRNYVPVAQQVFQTELSGRSGGGVTVLNNTLVPRTIACADGDMIRFDMTHTAEVLMNFWSSAHTASVAWYTVGVSTNGYLSVGPRDPTIAPPVQPPLQPQITGATFADAGQTQVTVTGIGGPTVAPLPYSVITSTDASLPLSSWTPYLTNSFATNGGFTFNFPVNRNEPRRFFKLKWTP